jgi:molybdopterin-binding protein
MQIVHVQPEIQCFCASANATTAHVEIELKGGETVISSITNEAVEELGLKGGTKAYAVIKASDVMIAIK